MDLRLATRMPRAPKEIVGKAAFGFTCRSLIQVFGCVFHQLYELRTGEDANGRRYSISSDGSLSVDSQLLSPPLRVSSLPSCGTSHCMALSRAVTMRWTSSGCLGNER